jgi:hypothetical protein
MSNVKGFNFNKLSSPQYQTHKRVPRYTQDQKCSQVITISSDGKACKEQGSVLGTYKVQSEKVMEWPTWKMANNRFLLRLPGGKGKDWLFAKSRESTVGWIKHRNCRRCPESCSQNWLYWNDNHKQWYLDTRIHVTTNDMRTTCSSESSIGMIISITTAVGCPLMFVLIFCCIVCKKKGTISHNWSGDGNYGNGSINLGTET